MQLAGMWTWDPARRRSLQPVPRRQQLERRRHRLHSRQHVRLSHGRPTGNGGPTPFWRRVVRGAVILQLINAALPRARQWYLWRLGAAVMGWPKGTLDH